MKAFVAVALFALLLVFVDARFVVEKSSITVLSPHKLRAKRDGAIGNFGLPDYGGFIVGSVLYPTKGSHGCQVFEGDKPFKIHSYRPTIVLLDRGGICLSFGSVFVDFDPFIDLNLMLPDPVFMVCSEISLVMFVGTLIFYYRIGSSID